MDVVCRLFYWGSTRRGIASISGSVIASATNLQGLVGLSQLLDYIPRQLVTAIVTNTHVVEPAQVPWLVEETYGPAASRSCA